MQKDLKVTTVPTDIVAFILLAAGIYYFYMLRQNLEVIVVCLFGIMYLLIRILYILPILLEAFAYKVQMLLKSKF